MRTRYGGIARYRRAPAPPASPLPLWRQPAVQYEWLTLTGTENSNVDPSPALPTEPENLFRSGPKAKLENWGGAALALAAGAAFAQIPSADDVRAACANVEAEVGKVLATRGQALSTARGELAIGCARGARPCRRCESAASIASAHAAVAGGGRGDAARHASGCHETTSNKPKRRRRFPPLLSRCEVSREKWWKWTSPSK